MMEYQGRDAWPGGPWWQEGDLGGGVEAQAEDHPTG